MHCLYILALFLYCSFNIGFLTPSLVYVQLYYQIEQESVADVFSLKGFADLFDEIGQEPFFNQLRYESENNFV